MARLAASVGGSKKKKSSKNSVCRREHILPAAPSTEHKFTFTALVEKRTKFGPMLSRHAFQSYTHTLGLDTGKAAKSTFFGQASSFDQQTDFSNLQ